ncbi:MAG: cytochrome c oxidase assembly protein, partial [Caldilineaceae bacterium]|nr:cytochrome c oxidase assembly protein [Caldilineaceae bacterium]
VNMIIGIVIANGSEVLYPYYNSVPRIWGFSALQDQMLAGVIMWIPGSMMLLLAALIVLARFGITEKPNRPTPAPVSPVSPESHGVPDPS